HLQAWTVDPATFQGPRGRMRSDNKWRYIGMAALLVISLLAWSAVREWKESATPAQPVSAHRDSEDRATFERDWAARPRVDVGVPADGAAVVVVVFTDWQCPSCEAAYDTYKPLIDQYERTMPGAVKYVTKDYPLNSRCNS